MRVQILKASSHMIDTMLSVNQTESPVYMTWVNADTEH